MIKKLIAALVAVTLLASATGCVTVGFSGNGHGNRENVEGKGEIISEDFLAGDFSKVKVDANVMLYYTAEKSDKVTIEAYENLMEYFSVSTNNGVLTIDCDVDINTDNGKSPKVYVSAPTLELLSIDGVVILGKADKITADSFELSVSGVFNCSLDLDVKNLTVDSYGVGNIVLSGTADTAFIETSGVGEIGAFGLQTKEAHVTTSGVGNIEISCSDKLTAEISSVGSVRYKGDPSVSVTEVSGVGGLKKVG